MLYVITLQRDQVETLSLPLSLRVHACVCVCIPTDLWPAGCGSAGGDGELYLLIIALK